MTEIKSSSSTARSNENEREDVITARHGQLINNFLDNNASHLIVYGLFCLRDGLKDRELCVLFCNDHFSTTFKVKVNNGVRFMEDKTLIMPCWITWLESLRKQRE